ncbi:MAG: hypothetical protein PHP54_01695 [Clostridia bacterium]|nr:hypothetical protein [Clostridia bacterium]
MTKKIYIKFALLFFVMNLICFVNIYAATGDNATNDVATDMSAQESEEIKQQKNQLNAMIKQLLDEIIVKINEIDARVEEIRSTKEYENYPAVRLNMDTPLFGLVTVTNNKLNISQDVSAGDVAAGYSIRSIVKNKNVKLPDVIFAGIVVSTKDIKLNEEISLVDANAAVLKLMQYSQKTDSTLEFLNNQINKNFKEYIPKERLETINELQRRLMKLESTLINQDVNHTQIDMLVENESEQGYVNNYLKEFNELSSDIKRSKIVTDNVLIDDEALRNAQRDVINIEARSLELSDKLEKALATQKESITIETLLQRIKTKLEGRFKLISDYINKSIEKVEIAQNNDNAENLSDNKENVTEDLKTVEEIKKYDVTSQDIAGLLKQDIDKIQALIEKYIPTKEENANDENQEVNNKEITAEEKESVLNQVYDIYKDYISRENKFYIVNINSVLKATTLVTSDVSKYTDSNVLEETNYIYMELPGKLEEYLDYYNTSLYIEIENMSDKLNEQLNKITNTYLKILKIYKDLNVEDIKLKA